ncbi:MAG TPA: hypothetical protein VGJ31_06345 [Dongiaceae bacterium]|jgi:hypothetical protein
MRTTALMLCVMLALMLPLVGCGKKGDPGPPVPDTFPNQYPKAETAPELKSQSGIPALPKPEQPPSALTPFQIQP